MSAHQVNNTEDKNSQPDSAEPLPENPTQPSREPNTGINGGNTGINGVNGGNSDINGINTEDGDSGQSPDSSTPANNTSEHLSRKFLCVTSFFFFSGFLAPSSSGLPELFNTVLLPLINLVKEFMLNPFWIIDGIELSCG